MKRTTPIRFSALTLAGALALSGGSASIALAKPPAKPAAPAKALKVNPAPYTRHLGLIGGNLRDIQAILDARMGENGKKPMTFKVRVAAQMPDSVRMDVLSSSNGLFQGWKFARVGSNVRLYDPISERSTMTDISKVTGRQPIRMDIGVEMFAGIFRPQNYTVTASSMTKLEGKPAVQLTLKPKPGFNDPKSFVRLSHILVWMDPAKKVPLRQVSYGYLPRNVPGVKGGGLVRLVEARFGAFQPAGGGVWYPTQVRMVREHARRHDDAPTNVTLQLTRVNGVLVPRQLSASGGEGSSVLRYSNIRVNTGLPASTFHPR